MKKRESDLKSAGEILKEIGFDPNSREETKIALIRFLYRQAYGIDIQAPVTEIINAQLSFNFDKNEAS